MADWLIYAIYVAEALALLVRFVPQFASVRMYFALSTPLRTFVTPPAW
jgi:hypothetical protein